MRQIWSFQSSFWKIIFNFQHYESIVGNLQHYGWQNLGRKVKNWAFISDTSFICLSQRNVTINKMPNSYWDKHFYSTIPGNRQHLWCSKISRSKPSTLRNSNFPILVWCHVRWYWAWWSHLSFQYLDVEKLEC